MIGGPANDSSASHRDQLKPPGRLRVCHLTSVHRADDTRIFFKECLTLARAGHQVFLVAADAATSRVAGVQIIGVRGSGGSRLRRMAITAPAVCRQAARLRADIYHFHDPELLPFAALLRLRGQPVVFDVHENISEQMKMKDWLPLKSVVGRAYRVLDVLASQLFPLVLAEQSYSAIYARFTDNFIVVQNMPDVAFLDQFKVTDRSGCGNGILYVGEVTKERGIQVVLDALAHLDQRGIEWVFHCVGPAHPTLLDEIENRPLFKRIKGRVRFYGRLSQEAAYAIARDCRVGIAVLQPVANYVSSYPTKIFEYMAVALPVIGSNFELYRNVIDRHGAGICVDPTDPVAIADALESLLRNPGTAGLMGRNGRRAVETEYSWDSEGQKLLAFYQRLVSTPGAHTRRLR